MNTQTLVRAARRSGAVCARGMFLGLLLVYGRSAGAQTVPTLGAELAISHAGASAVITWSARDFVLEHTADLGGPWEDVAVAGSPNGAQYSVHVPTGLATEFFRLRFDAERLVIPTDRLAILARGGVGTNELAVLEPRYGLRFIDEQPGGILVFGVAAGREAKALARWAAQIKVDQTHLIAQAGLVAQPLAATAAMILTDELIVQFRPGTDRARVDALNAAQGVAIVQVNPFRGDQYLLRVADPGRILASDLSRHYAAQPEVEYAEPNCVMPVDYQANLNDPLLGNQWHLNNTGQGGGTVDADIDACEAWDITLGNASVLVGVIDDGFDTAHPDLAPNLWRNPGETGLDAGGQDKATNGQDDDGNGFVDDLHGWDFWPTDGDNTLGGTLNCAPDWQGGCHGTAVAGCVAARGNNNLGVSGSCPDCGLMVIRNGATIWTQAMAFDYATVMGADIITCSWVYRPGYRVPVPVAAAILASTLAGRDGKGCVVLFAMNNAHQNDCSGPIPSISSLPNVIAVSRANNRDRFDFSAYGNCLDVLAPSFCPRAAPICSPQAAGTQGITTTDIRGVPGYDPTDYTPGFNGTSAATPIAAGIAGLLLSVSPNLTGCDVQRLLQDTCDKIEDSAGGYSAITGFSSPPGGVATHGYGRVNAFEAVRVVAPPANGGRGGVDIFVRDNRLDWGNTEQPSHVLFEPNRGFIAPWESADIKVDAPPYQPAPTTPAGFDAFQDENAVPNTLNRVYLRVRNRGPDTATAVTAKLYWAVGGTALPALPADFWTRFPGDATDVSQWHPLGVRTIWNLAYSGASQAGRPGDAAQIVAFDFAPPAINPTGTELRNHCLLAIVDSTADPISPASRASFVPDHLAPRDNNVALRNVTLLNGAESRSFSEPLYVRNPQDAPLETQLAFTAPRNWTVTLADFAFNVPFTLAPGEERAVEVRIERPAFDAAGTVTIVQQKRHLEPDIMGGFTFVVPRREMDFGDAPDPRYPTFLASNGARHALMPRVFLGQRIDAEPDGQPDVGAAGDDLAVLPGQPGPDDEDGVAFDVLPAPGGTAQISVWASISGLLNAWIDWNQNGDWTDPEDRVFTDEPLTASFNHRSFNAPSSAVPGITYARFRFSTAGGLSITNAAPDGEVEDYVVEVEPPRPGIDLEKLTEGADADTPPGPTLAAGSPVTWTYLVRNSGNVSLSSIQVTDDRGVAVNCPKTTLVPGETMVCTATGLAIAGQYANVGTVIAATPSGSRVTDSDPSHYFGATRPMDFGDAADLPYATLLARNGARHLINPDVFLGMRVDGEPDGQPLVTADGDDQNGADDEDGVVFTSPLISGHPATVDVITSIAGGFLNAWVDFDGNGDWSGEQVFIDRQLGLGTNHLSVAVPVGLAGRNVAARFRFSTAPGLGVLGEAPDGEVEDYQVRIEEAGEIRGVKFRDLNANGIRDAGEPGLPGWTIYLDADHDGQRDAGETSTRTRANGEYAIAGLLPGGYWVAEEQQPGWQESPGKPGPIIERVSRNAQGAEGNSESRASSISADGRFVAFDSRASNLVPNDGNGTWDVFVFDRQTGQIERVSRNAQGAEGNDASLVPSISADGRFVAFASDATNLVPNDGNNAKDVFVFDRQTGQIERVSRNAQGAEANYGSFNPSISADGRFVAFESGAANLVPNDRNGSFDVFVFDRQTGQIERVSRNAQGFEGNDWSVDSSISADGRFVAFHSEATNLVPNDGTKANEVFVFDRQTSQIERVSRNAQGAGGNSGSRGSSIRADGRFVAFDSRASNLVPNDGNGTFDVFVFDRQTGQIERVSRNAQGAEGNDGSFVPSISADGRFVAFESYATNLVPNDGNGGGDVFVVDRSPAVSGDARLAYVNPGKATAIDFGNWQLLDYGDARAPFPTLWAENGARHVFNPDVFLGQGVDAEPDGQRLFVAQGDDDNGVPDDEDGVSVNVAPVPTGIARLTVVASRDGLLNAWMDLYANDNWTDPGEQVLTNRVLVPGSNLVDFRVPADAVPGATLARFRFSTVGGLSFDGEAPDGEVEDYSLEIGRPLDTGQWQLSQTLPFVKGQAAHFHPLDGRLYVARRMTDANPHADDGLYRLEPDGSANRVAVFDRPAGVAVDAATGNLFVSEDVSGNVYRVEFATLTRSLWVSGFHAGDDDPMGLAVVLPDYRGGVAQPGDVLVVDRGIGTGARDEVWRFSASTPEGETVVHADDGTLELAADVAVGRDDVYVADPGTAAIYRMRAGGALERLATARPLPMPVGIVVDPLTGLLLVLDGTERRLFEVDPATGVVRDLFPALPTQLTGPSWPGLDVAADGMRVVVTDYAGDKLILLTRALDNPIPDRLPPRLLDVSPPQGARPFDTIEPVREVRVTLDERLDPATISGGSLKVFSAGPDKEHHTPDDILVAGGQPMYRRPARDFVLALPVPYPLLGPQVRSSKALPAGPKPPAGWNYRLVFEGSEGSFQLFSAGPDGEPGTADDAALLGGNPTYRQEQHSLILALPVPFPEPLPAGEYRVVLDGAGPGSLQVYSAGADGSLGTSDDLALLEGQPAYREDPRGFVFSLPAPILEPLPAGSYRVLLGGSRGALQLFAAGPDGELGTVDDLAMLRGEPVFRFDVQEFVFALPIPFPEPLLAGSYRALLSGGMVGTLEFFSAGRDGVLGNTDDRVLIGAAPTYRAFASGSELTLPLVEPAGVPGNYRVVLSGALSDTAGNRLGHDFSWVFEVRNGVFGEWHLEAILPFADGVAAHFNPVDGWVYVGRRVSESPNAADGLYRVALDGQVEKVVDADRPAAVAVDPVSGAVLFAEDYAGIIYRVPLNEARKLVWVSGFHAGDDDPKGLAVAPPDYAGSRIGSRDGVVVDFGFLGPKEAWRFSAETAQGATALHSDNGTLMNAFDVAIGRTEIYLVDARAAEMGSIYRVEAGGALEALPTSEPLPDPDGIAVDAETENLLVLDSAERRLVTVSPTTGAVTNALPGFAEWQGPSWAGVDVSPDGQRLFVTDRVGGKVFVFRRTGPVPWDGEELRPFETAELGVAGLEVDPPYPAPGEPVRVMVEIKNTGAVAANAVPVEFSVNGVVIGGVRLNVPASATIITNLGWTPDTNLVWVPKGIGEHTLTVQVDPKLSVPQFFRADDVSSRLIVVADPRSPAEYRVAGITPTEYEARPIAVRVTVTASGGPRLSVPVELLDAEERVIGASLAEFDHGASTAEVVFPLSPETSLGLLTARVNPRGFASENNPDDNTLRQDLRVVVDLAVHSLSLHSVQGHEGGPQRVTASFRVTNVGKTDVSAPFEVRALALVREAGGVLREVAVERFQVEELEAGQSRFVSHTFQDMPHVFIVRADVDAAQWLGDGDRTNNAVEQPLSNSTPNPGRWVALGPQRLTDGLGAVGRIHHIVVDPSDRRTIYAGAAHCGLWRTRDEGDSWTPITDSLPSLAVYGLAVDPNTPARVYLMTKEGFYRSPDRGASWERLANAPNPIGDCDLIVHPVDPNLLLATTRSGIARSTDGGRTWPSQPALGGALGMNLVLDPLNHDRVVATLFEPDDKKAPADYGRVGVWESWSRGAPGTWRQLDGCPGGRLPVMTAYSKAYLAASGSRLYAGYQTHSGGNRFSLYRTTDIGCSIGGVGESRWEKVWETTHPISRIEADPVNRDNVYGHYVGNESQFWYSHNGGKSFSQATDVHVDHHAFAFDPVDPRIVYTGTDGGIYRSKDRGRKGTWEFIGQGLMNVEVYDLANSPHDPNLMLIGTQDNGTVRTKGTLVWEHIRNGDGATCGFDPLDPDVWYSMEQFAGSIHRYSGGQACIGCGLSGIKGEFSTDEAGRNMQYLVHPVPRDGRTMIYAPVESLRRWTGKSCVFCPSSDPGFPNNWTPVSFMPPNESVVRVGADPSPGFNDGIIYAGTDRGGILAAKDAAWGLLPTPVFTHPQRARVTDIHVSTWDRATVWVTFQGTTGAPRIYRLRRHENPTQGNFFESAEPIAGDLPDMKEVQCIAVDPRVGGAGPVYVGSADRGVWRGSPHTVLNKQVWLWAPYNNGLPGAADVRDLEIVPQARVLRAATYGRGVYEVATQSMGPERTRTHLKTEQRTCSSTFGVESPHGLVPVSRGQSKEVSLPPSTFQAVCGTAAFKIKGPADANVVVVTRPAAGDSFTLDYYRDAWP